MKINFFTVTLPDNIQTLTSSIKVINKYYDVQKFSIICPDAAMGLFANSFNSYSNVIIIPESSLISITEFIEIASHYKNENGHEIFKSNRIGWYYQQALKISFIFKKDNNDYPLVMWDADTIPLCKIDFFKNDKSLLYGSLIEFHQPYFKTMKTIFGTLPFKFLAFTVQFFTCTYTEAKFLESKLNQYYQKMDDMTIGQWIAKIVIQSTYETHNLIDDSFFSEQELVGLSVMLGGVSTQLPISYLRWDFDGLLTPSQIFFVRTLGFKHITYENMSQLKGKKQSWINLIYLTRKELHRQRPNSPLNFSIKKFILKYFKKF